MELLAAVVNATAGSGKPIVVVLFSGGGLAVETIVKNTAVGGIIHGFYPGVSGATAGI
jgi:hypothetical protein